MPLEYDTPVSEEIPITETKSVKAIQITTLIIKLSENIVDAVYIKGYDDGAGGITYNTAAEYKYSWEGQGYIDMVTANGVVYTDVKNTMYAELQTVLGITGTVV